MRQTACPNRATTSRSPSPSGGEVVILSRGDGNDDDEETSPRVSLRTSQWTDPSASHEITTTTRSDPPSPRRSGSKRRAVSFGRRDITTDDAVVCPGIVARAPASPRRVTRTPTPPIPRPGSFRPGGGRRAHVHTARRCPVPSLLAPCDSVGSHDDGEVGDGTRVCTYFRTHLTVPFRRLFFIVLTRQAVADKNSIFFLVSLKIRNFQFSYP